MLVLAACGGDDSSSSANTTSTLSNTHFDVETPDGQVSLALNGNLPPGWPSDFPVPDGASPAGSGSFVDTAKGGARIGVYQTSHSPDDTFNFYKSNNSLTITGSGSVGSGDNYVGTIQFGGSAPGNVTIVSSKKDSKTKTYIVATLNTEASTTTTT